MFVNNNPDQSGEKASLHLLKNNNNNNNSKQRPMYHYLYGSVDGVENGGGPGGGGVESSLNVSADTTSCSTATHGKSSSVGGDLDSLVGEALVCTDTEDESVSVKGGRGSRGDFEQLLLTNGGGRGTNGGTSALLTGGSRELRKQQQDELTRRACSGPAACFGSFLVCLLLFSSFAVVHFVFPPMLHSPVSQKAITGGASAAFPTSSGDVPSYKIPFPRADRNDYQDPVEGILVVDLFHPDLLYQGKDTSRTFTFPFPTGAFWTNLVLPPTADEGLSYPIFVFPYGFKWSDELLHVSYPYAHRREEPKAVHDYFFPDLKFSSNETVKVRHLTGFDALSVTLQFETANKGLWTTYLVQGSPYINMEFGSVTPQIETMSTFLSLSCPQGTNSSYVKDGSGTRRRRNLSYGVCEDDFDPVEGVKRVHGVQFMLKTAEGWTWMLFTSVPIVLELNMKLPTMIRATEPYNGAFRAAIVPSNGMSADDLAKSTGVQRLVNHAGVYPIHGEVSWVFGTSQSSSSSSSSSFVKTAPTTPAQRVGSVSFKYQTRSFTPSTGNLNTVKPLLMMALPHHAKRMPSSAVLNSDAFDVSYRTIKGRMTPVIGSTWTYEQNLVSPGFDDDSGSNGLKLYLDPVVKSAIVANMIEDINLEFPTKTENIYGFGKQAARLAQLAHIADRLLSKDRATSSAKNTTTSSSGNDKSENDMLSSMLAQVTKSLYSCLEELLTGLATDFLVYDANLGGMVTRDGLLDTGADFGNGRYNDHHFHYGYLMYACAIMGRLDPSFVQKYKSHVDAIYFDVAHNSNFDSRQRLDGVFFPGARHMNWFHSHSYASGLFPFGNGKSQESSSEAVNCYYGAYLWSVVRNLSGENPETDKSAETDYARLLLSMEITGAQTYWHMIPYTNSTNQSNQTTGLAATTATTRPRVYSDQFASNYMVGNVGMNDAVCTTWFGTQALYVHMINFIPVTAAAGELFEREYAKAEYESALAELGEVEMSWRGFIVSHRAISDPNAAWQDAHGLSSAVLDNGLSKTQILYWIATRKGFVPPSGNPSTFGPAPSPQSNSSHSGDACELHEFCNANGLSGKCCPTSNGVMLDCC